MASNTIDYAKYGKLGVLSPIAGSALLIPPGIWEPGSFAAHKGHFGQGSTLIPFSAALVAGPSITSPLTWNFVGLGNEVGVRNIFGADIKSGSSITLGALESSATGISNKIGGGFCKVTPKCLEVTPGSNNASPGGRLNGFWTYNGKPLNLLHFHSDIRLKEDIHPLNDNDSLHKLLRLNPVSYLWKESTPTSLRNGFPEGRQIGLIAQEVNKHIPEVVKDETLSAGMPGDTKEYKGVDYGRLTTLLIGAIKDQQKQIESLKSEVAVLKEKCDGC